MRTPPLYLLLPLLTIDIVQETNGFTPQAYLEYISWEREVKRPDIPLVKGLFERAIHDHPREIELWETWIEFLVRTPSSLPRDRADPFFCRTGSPTASRTFWTLQKGRLVISRRTSASGRRG